MCTVWSGKCFHEVGDRLFPTYGNTSETVLIRRCLIFPRRTTDVTLRISFVFSAPPHITQISFYIVTYRNPPFYTFFTGIIFELSTLRDFSCSEPWRRVGLGGRPPIPSQWAGLLQNQSLCTGERSGRRPGRMCTVWSSKCFHQFSPEFRSSNIFAVAEHTRNQIFLERYPKSSLCYY
jgi:hypothetical protein